VCRYIQAAASPKDMVILIDSSGSMKGLRMEIAKATVEKIVDTLNDDDFFNVVKVTTTIAKIIISRRSQHSQECKDPRRQCFCN